MNTLHLKEIDWKQYLATPPTESPAQWLSDLLNGFKAGFIDHADIHLALQRYEPSSENYRELLRDCWIKMLKEERRQDMNRARIYKEQHK